MKDRKDRRIKPLANLESLGLAAEQKMFEGRDIKVDTEGFDASEDDPGRLRNARQARKPGGVSRLLNGHDDRAKGKGRLGSSEAPER